MAENNRALEPVDALATEKSDSTYEFPTSENMSSSNADNGSFREASKSWDKGGDASSASDLRLSAKNKFADVQDAMTRKYRAAADTTDDFVHENPWKAITMATLVGLVVGMLAAR
ncbi:membrane protein [Caballeronia fortuita]|uniref:Membrane protein n=1 Tax=Caballeronia fortuita TaxID=1777138 RepID=A0A158C5X8_9BURK|nr:DUF883 family protein [Caballeronia fortuita]SAK77748.1 membrane protein [Caballeronia fortuita]